MVASNENGNNFLTRREAEVLIQAGIVQAVDRQKLVDARLEAHEDVHDQEQHAIRTALEAVQRESRIHAEAHGREHQAHGREHQLQEEALNKAERASETRFQSVNEFREQLRDQAARLASQERVDALSEEVNRRFNEMNASMLQHFQAAEKLTQDRYDTNRASIIAIEKADVKGEGRSLGQGATIAAIVGSVTFVSIVLGLIIVVANLLTGSP